MAVRSGAGPVWVVSGRWGVVPGCDAGRPGCGDRPDMGACDVPPFRTTRPGEAAWPVRDAAPGSLGWCGTPVPAGPARQSATADWPFPGFGLGFGGGALVASPRPAPWLRFGSDDMSLFPAGPGPASVAPALTASVLPPAASVRLPPAVVGPPPAAPVPPPAAPVPPPAAPVPPVPPPAAPLSAPAVVVLVPAAPVSAPAVALVSPSAVVGSPSAAAVSAPAASPGRSPVPPAPAGPALVSSVAGTGSTATGTGSVPLRTSPGEGQASGSATPDSTSTPVACGSPSASGVTSSPPSWPVPGLPTSGLARPSWVAGWEWHTIKNTGPLGSVRKQTRWDQIT